MLVILPIAALVVCAWAAWLFRSATMPAWARWLVLLAAGAFVAVSGYALVAVKRAFPAVSQANPAERQAVLSTAFADAFGVLAIGGAATLVAMIGLTVLRFRSRARGGREDG